MRNVLDHLAWALLAAALLGAALLFAALRPPELPYAAHETVFLISPGEGVRGIASRLGEAGLVRSPFAFTAFSFLTGNAGRIRAGTYALRSDAGAVAILHTLTGGSDEDVQVTVPEGLTMYEIDDMLARAGVIRPSDLIGYQTLSSVAAEPLEGTLFPDTYRFHRRAATEGSQVRAEFVIEKMHAAFARKAEPLLPRDPDEAKKALVLASILEREVPDHRDRRIVAGILLKREKIGMPLQADATVCYAKEVAAGRAVPCLPLTAADLKMDSPYNTYVNQGLPPGPIGNPGLDAVKAAVSPLESPYFYYLSDPATGKTVFSRTLEEHAANRRKYLR